MKPRRNPRGEYWIDNGGRDAYGKILRVPLTVEIMQGRLTKG